jgi:hypothetical protein
MEVSYVSIADREVTNRERALMNTSIWEAMLDQSRTSSLEEEKKRRGETQGG